MSPSALSPRPVHRTLALVLPLALGAALPPAPAAAQNIVLKTVPIPTGEQFLLFPSSTLGMGSPGVALDDEVGLAFSNPAHRLPGPERGRVFAAPTFYGETNGWVGGRTLPMLALVRGERLHGGVGVAVQQVQDRQGWRCGWGCPVSSESSLIQGDPSNSYLFGTVGVRLGDVLTVGVSGLRASLQAVDGVNMLYGRAWSIEQDGSLTELRLGAVAELGRDRRLDGTITRTHVDLTHDVGYVEWVWPDVEDPWNYEPTVLEWTEVNEDHTITWGTRLRYTQPLDDATRVGLVLGGSTKAHPKIPNYNIVNIPRDPGNSAVFNLGVGLSRQEAGSTMAMEVVFEPGRSHTWAFADTATTLPSGAILEPGDKTVDNQFRFMNWHVALGFDRELGRFGLQLGLRVRQIGYSLDQEHYLEEVRRETEESWMEWTPSWGGRAAFGGMSVRYDGRFTARGWPDGPMFGWGGVDVMAVADASPGVDFVVGATGPVNIPAYRVTTHRLTLSVPFGL